MKTEVISSERPIQIRIKTTREALTTYTTITEANKVAFALNFMANHTDPKGASGYIKDWAWKKIGYEKFAIYSPSENHYYHDEALTVLYRH